MTRPANSFAKEFESMVFSAIKRLASSPTRSALAAIIVSARLLSYQLQTADASVFANARTRLAGDPWSDGLTGQDPAGITLRLALRGAQLRKEEAA
jgi:hypothetical protein